MRPTVVDPDLIRVVAGCAAWFEGEGHSGLEGQVSQRRGPWCRDRVQVITAFGLDESPGCG